MDKNLSSKNSLTSSYLGASHWFFRLITKVAMEDVPKRNSKKSLSASSAAISLVYAMLYT